MYGLAQKAGESLATDVQLLEHARLGDRQALNQLVELHWQPLYRYIYYKVRNKEVTEELTQETFIKVITYLPKFEERGIPFRSFIIRVAANIITDYWRKHARGKEVLPLTDIVSLSSNDSLDELAVLEERKSIIDAAIRQLPDEQRYVVILRLIEGRPIKEVAIMMQKTEGALKMLQQRALQNIRKYLAAQPE